MNQKLVFEDGTILEFTIDIPEEEGMALIAYQRLLEYIEEALFDDPEIRLHAGDESISLDDDEEDVDDIGLDEDDVDDFDDEWDDEGDEFEDEDWLDDDEDEYEDDWVSDR